MNRALPLAAAFAVLALIPRPGAADEWQRTYAFSGRPDLRVIADDAHVSVRTWDRKGAEVRITTVGWEIGRRGVRVTDRRDGDALAVEIRGPRWELHFGRRSIQVEVLMPEAADLDVSTGDGSVTIPPLNGSVRVHTGDGGIVLEGVQGAISLSTGDGRVVARDVQGSLEAHTGDGSVHATGRFDRLELTTGDGHITAVAEEGSRMEGRWTLRSGDGGLDLRVPRDLEANLDAHSGDGGVSLGIPVAVSGRPRRSTVRGTLNGGGPQLLLRTGDGSIRVDAL